jgi:hypothetical protein
MAADKVKEMKPRVKDTKVRMDLGPVPCSDQLRFGNRQEERTIDIARVLEFP